MEFRVPNLLSSVWTNRSVVPGHLDVLKLNRHGTSLLGGALLPANLRRVVDRIASVPEI